MGSPRVVDMLILDLKNDLKRIKDNLISEKYNFCVRFDKDMGFDISAFSESVFDYCYNLFFFKKAWGTDLAQHVKDFRDQDFRDPAKTTAFIMEKYQEFPQRYKQFFMDYMGFRHDDPLYMTRKVLDDRGKSIEKFMRYGDEIGGT